MPTAGIDFAGQSDTSAAIPADPSGAAGPNDYVQVVNSNIEMWNKTGTVLVASKPTNSLWSGYVGTHAGNGCLTRSDGDALVRYDRQAERWIVAQMSLPNVSTSGGPTFECVAVSKTGDPRGAYWLYDFAFPVSSFDQPNIGVWSDGYYFSASALDLSGGSYAYNGDEVCAWNRAAMLSGGAAAPQCFLLAAPSNPLCAAAQAHTPFSYAQPISTVPCRRPRGHPNICWNSATTSAAAHTPSSTCGSSTPTGPLPRTRP
jgi:hypothetical protein